MNPMFYTIAVFLIVAIFCDWIIYKSLHHSKDWAKKLFYSSILIYIFSVIIRILHISFSEDTDILYNVMWLIYLTLTFYFPKFTYVLFLSLNYVFLRKRHTNFIKTFGALLSIFMGGMLLWGNIVTRNQVDVKDVNITVENLPDKFVGYKIVQFSDIHLGSYGGDTVYVSKVVNTINELQADMVVFTGDIVNRYAYELEPYTKILSRIKAKDGVFTILGNHDYGDYGYWENDAEKFENFSRLVDLEAEMNWTLLNNKSIIIKNDNDSIVLIGVENWGEPPFKLYGDLKQSYKDLNDSSFKILLSHNPSHWNAEVVDSTNIFLTLSGHTHAMQTVFEFGDFRFSPAEWRYKEWGGLYSQHNQYLYVNIGLGEVGIPARFGAKPEITFIVLNKQ